MSQKVKNIIDCMSVNGVKLRELGLENIDKIDSLISKYKSIDNDFVYDKLQLYVELANAENQYEFVKSEEYIADRLSEWLEEGHDREYMEAYQQEHMEEIDKICSRISSRIWEDESKIKLLSFKRYFNKLTEMLCASPTMKKNWSWFDVKLEATYDDDYCVGTEAISIEVIFDLIYLNL